MSSSAEQESRVDSRVARALEAARDPFLRKIAERFQKEPNQILKLSEILGFTIEEEKDAKALVWLKKHEPERYLVVLQSSEAENKQTEEKMKVEWGVQHYDKKVHARVGKLFTKIQTILEKILPNPAGDLRFVWGVDATEYGNRGVLRVVSVPVTNTQNTYPSIFWESSHLHTRVLDVELALSTHATYAYQDLKEKRGWAGIAVHVEDKAFLSSVKRFARIYEKRSKCFVAIQKDY